MTTIEEYLAAARSRFRRVSPADLEAELADGSVLVDIRPEQNRIEDGELPGAIVIERGVLEWRLAPSSEFRSVELTPGQKVILFCNEGYQSSLAAAALVELGVNATDLVGGFRAWKKTARGKDR